MSRTDMTLVIFCVPPYSAHKIHASQLKEGNESQVKHHYQFPPVFSYPRTRS